MHRIEWTPAVVKKVKSILAKHTRAGDALGDIHKQTGISATEDSLVAAFRRNGLGKPSSYCRTVKADAPVGRAPSVKPVGELVKQLLKVVRGKPLSFEAVCDKMGMSPRACRTLIEQAQKDGYSFHVTHGDVSFKLPEDNERVKEVKVAPTKGPRHKVAVISDTHLGSKYCLRAQLKEFIEYAYSQGVREILHPGDVLDGAYHHGIYELTHSGIDAQTQDLFETLPQLPGLSYHCICGNHDDTFSDSIGMDAGLFIQRYFENRGRNDLKFYGRRGAFLRLHGAVFELWHPRKNPGYALSYAIQNHIRDAALGNKGDFLCVGHFHTWCYIEQRGVHALQCGTFQGGGSSFSKSLGGASSLGGTIISWEATAGGTIRRVQVERSAYYENETRRDICK